MKYRETPLPSIHVFDVGREWLSELFGITGFAVLALWFAGPFLIAFGYLVQLAVYDIRIGNYGISPAKYFERKKNIRKEDEKYDLLCRKRTKWWVITAIWWTISFFMVALISIVRTIVSE